MRSLIVLALAVLATAVGAQEQMAPAKGVFLVAEPEIAGGPFYKSVVFLLAHDSDGSLGLIVNRRTKIPLAEVRPDLDPSAPNPKLYFGGPVGLEGLLVLFRSDTPLEGAVRVMEDLYYSGSADVLEKLLAAGERAVEPRLFIGHSGWAPGQLQSELRRGSWDVQRADASTVLGPDTESLWERLTLSGRVYALVQRTSQTGPFRADARGVPMLLPASRPVETIDRRPQERTARR